MSASPGNDPRFATLRVAFLTPEYPTEMNDAGGLATYLRRMVRVLREAGHEAEVFTISTHAPGTVNFEGAVVHRVAPSTHAPEQWQRALARLPQRVFPMRIVGRARQASALAAAMEARHAERPFDVVQSPNYGLSGMYVRSCAPRVHVIRCSQATELYERAERSLVASIRGGFSAPSDALSARVERSLFRRVDAVYAPSEFVADFYRREFAMNVRTVRPPFLFEDAPGTLPPGVPNRYFAFVGKGDRVKGGETLARAIDVAARETPDIRVVVAGSRHLLDYARKTRAPSSSVVWLGPLKKGALYAVVRGALALLAPAHVDNLPNAVIEALMLGTPVIGSRGASIDELVEDGVTGQLVEIGDANALADAMVRGWRGKQSWKAEVVASAKRLEMLSPGRALDDFLSLVGEARRSNSVERIR